MEHFFDTPTTVIVLENSPRFMPWIPHIRIVGWFRDHLYYHHGTPVCGDNVSVVLQEDPGRKITLADGREIEDTESAPYIGCTPDGTRFTTKETVLRDELTFQYAPGVLAPYPFPRMKFRVTPAVLEAHGEILDLLGRAQEPGIPDRIDLLALRLIAEAQRSARQTEGGGEAVDPRVYRIAARLAADCGRAGGVEDFVRDSGMSRSAFYRAWNAYSRIAPGEILRDNRLRLAAELLRSSSFSVKEIAARCGFRGGAGLAQAFSERYGISPRDYRAGREIRRTGSAQINN